MRIDFNRICKLAGINDNSRSRSFLNEGADHGKEQEEAMNYNEGDPDVYGEGDLHGEADEQEEMMKYEMGDLHGEGDMTYEADEDKKDKEKDEDEKDDEVVEVNISELMSEIRRAKKIIKLNEQRSRNERSRKQQLQENKLKRVIAREVQSVLAEMQEYDDEYGSEWVYGNRKPRHSKRGYSAQGSFIPGVGFRRR